MQLCVSRCHEQYYCMLLKLNMPEPRELGKIAKDRVLALASIAAWFIVYTNLLAIFLRLNGFKMLHHKGCDRTVTFWFVDYVCNVESHSFLCEFHSNALTVWVVLSLQCTVLIWFEYIDKGIRMHCILNIRGAMTHQQKSMTKLVANEFNCQLWVNCIIAPVCHAVELN